MSKTRKAGNIKFKAATGILLFVLLLSTALLLLSLWEKRQGRFPAQEVPQMQATITHNGEEYVLKDDIETVLVMGLDKYEEATDDTSYNNDKQADFLMLLVFDNTNSKCTALHINRDTMAEMNILGVAGQKVGTVEKQIALAHTYGNGQEVSCRNTADAVSALLLNTKINHYVSMTMDGVAAFNDLLGGVEVTVLDDFTGIDDTLVKGETVTLMGEQALRYVRTRYGLDDSSNDTRMTRQRQYLEALLAKAQSRVAQDEGFVIDASAQMSNYLVSNCTVNQLQTLFDKLTAYTFEKIYVLEGEFTLGEKYMEFRADESSVKEAVLELFYIPEN